MFKKISLILILLPLFAYSGDWKLMESLEYFEEDQKEHENVYYMTSSEENSCYLLDRTTYKVTDDEGNPIGERDIWGIKHSSDQGFSWQYMNEDLYNNEEIEKFKIYYGDHYSFGSEKFIIAIGYPSILGGENSGAYGAAIGISNDSGKTFEVTEIYKSHSNSAPQLEMLNDSSGYFLIDDQNNDYLLFITQDGWKNFDTIKAEKDYNINYSSYLTENIIQSAGYIYNNENNESTYMIRNYNIEENSWKTIWHEEESPNLEEPEYIYYKDDKTGFAFSSDLQKDQYTLFKTTDAGESWNKVYETNNYDISNINFYDDLNGIALGFKGGVLLTNNGGKTWVESKFNDEQFNYATGNLISEWIGKKLVAGERASKMFIYTGEYFNFEIEKAIPKLPACGTTNTALSLNLKWTYAPGATKYKLQVAAEESFSDPIVDKNEIEQNSFNLEGLAKNTKYYWRVQAYNSTEEAGWSKACEFTTGTGNSVGEKISEFNIHPNPAGEYIEISIETNKMTDEKILIYNSLGEAVAQKQFSMQNNLQKIDVSHLLPGIYFVRIGERVEKFVKY